MFEWVVTVWANIFPLKMSSRIWDQWLFYGEVFFWRVVLAICALVSEKAEKDGDPGMMIMLFKGIS